MLRLNMAVPPTPRNDPAFSSEGLLAAAVAGLTDPTYASSTDLQFIPNMDGFPNGRRLEDDVTRIELQAVGGIVLAAIGLWYDDRDLGESPLSQDLIDVLTFSAGVEENDAPLEADFPYVPAPWSGVSGDCSGELAQQAMPVVPISLLTFTGMVETKANLLQWATASELNNDFFTLQRSTDGGNTFVKVTTVDGAGNSNTTKSYSYRDQKTQNGTVYYRLLQTDFNGQTKQVGQVALTRTATNLMIAGVSPVPARDNLKVQFSTTANQNLTVRLYDVFGRTMSEREVTATAGQQTLTFDVSDFASGTYFVLISNGKELKVQKFVKQ